jgi:mRNA interferase RelE/StbE
LIAVQFTAGAKADLAKLDPQVAQRILKRIRWLAENFEQISPEPLVGDWQGFFKLRIGDYRAIYSIQDENRMVFHVIRHRREVYKP